MMITMELDHAATVKKSGPCNGSQWAEVIIRR
jgi:hypothetical protein